MPSEQRVFRPGLLRGQRVLVTGGGIPIASERAQRAT
jgi:hypothetical protein